MNTLKECLDRIRRNDATLTEINLRSKRLGNCGGKQLLAALKNSIIAGGILYIDLANNGITDFDASDAGLTNLENLNLNYNYLTDFSAEGLGALQRLILRNNRLTSFSGEGLEALQDLYINNNRLTSFSGEGLGALQKLRLYNNQLTSVCKIMLEAMRPNLRNLDYGYPINAQAVNQALTEAMLTEHFHAILVGAAQSEPKRNMLWLSMVRRIGLPDELSRMIFECAYGMKYIITKELKAIKEILPEQAENVRTFEESNAFARIKAQYVQCENSFNAARAMQALLSSYRQHRDTTDLRDLQDNIRIDQRNNQF